MDKLNLEKKIERGYSLNNTYSELFWKFPQFLIKNEKYKKMKDSSKIAYMLFKDRIPFAIHKNWVDKNNLLYLIFEQKELMELLNCYQGKVKSILDELVLFGLLEIERGGFDSKTKKNVPNRYYLLQPELTESDLYLITKNAENLDNSGYAEIARRGQNAENLDNSGYAEIARRGQNAENLDNSGYAEIARSKDISINQDTKREDTKREDTKKQQISNSSDENFQLDKSTLQEQELLNHFAETHQEYSFLNYENLSLIQLFSDSLLDAENMIGIILRAKKRTEKQFNQVLIADDTYAHDELLDIQGNIAKTLRRIYQKRKTDSKIENIDNYVFASFTAIFTKLMNELIEYTEIS